MRDIWEFFAVLIIFDILFEFLYDHFNKHDLDHADYFLNLYNLLPTASEVPI